MTEELKKGESMLLNECLESLALIIEYNMKDFPLHQHALRVGEGCVLIGEKMGLDAFTLQKMYYAGLLHDIGKISVDKNLLDKKGGLSDEEFEVIKKHTVFGSQIIATLPGMNELALWVRWHHERWNGTGYPDGLHENEIPVADQILSTVDCFDSLQTPRNDRDRFPQEKAYEIIEKNRGSHFNPIILDLLLEMVEEKTLLPGRSSEKFLDLKEKYINVPMTRYYKGYWEGSGIAALYPILRLFARVIDTKHHYTRGHSTRVSILSRYLAEKMSLSSDDIIKIEVAGLLHDAGKISVPTDILDKPGRPNEDEWAIIQGHPSHSFNILSKISSLSYIAEISASHHERYDGKGYPNHTAGDNLNILSQIIAVADTYDAITSTRSYRTGQPAELAYKIIRENLGTQFHPKAGGILLDTSPKYIKALFDMYEVND